MTPQEQSFAARVEAQTLACIGCNDCLLSCPLPQARGVSIGELNAAVHAPSLSASNVAGFVAACTQCQQCVPVCPADLSRADMVLFNKFKLEDSVLDHELLLSARTVTMPSGLWLDDLSQRLSHLELFARVEPRVLRRMLLRSTLRFLVPGEQLCGEGEFYERLAVVLSGAIEQICELPNGQQMQSVRLAAGGFFGEMGVMGGLPESSGARALEPSVVLEVPKLAGLRMAEQAAGFGELMVSLYARRALWTYTQSPGALGSLSEAVCASRQRRALCSYCRESLVPAGEPPRILPGTQRFLRVRVRMRPAIACSSICTRARFGALAILHVSGPAVRL